MAVSDKTLVCRDCGTSFTFTAGEQAFYQERGFVEPTRCPACRAARRQARTQLESTDDGERGALRSERRFFPATCAECGRETMVPFEPRLGRPVYCRECFERLRAG